MRIRSPSLSELHAFVAVVETGGFSRAAAKLAVTQGAISRAVLRLEARLGFALIERGGNTVIATETGRRYYAQLQPALAALEAAVPTPAVAMRRQLRLSVIPTLSVSWLVPRLPSLYAAVPDLQLLFQPYRHADNLLRDDVDCWLIGRPTATSRWPRHVRTTYIVGREIVPICHPRQTTHIREPHDLLNFPLLHHTGYPQNWALWCASQGLGTRDLKLGTGFDLAAGLIEAVMAGMGVAVVQRCLVERELAERRVVAPLPHDVSTGRGYYLCVPRARDDAPMLTSFRNWLLEQV